jgi:steroid delta-isomerase
MTSLDHLIACYENLSPESISRLTACYAPDAVFKDPFNQVIGPEAIGQIFSHMFRALESPAFKVSEKLEDGRTAFLVWDFSFGPAHKRRSIHGVTRLVFDEEGQVKSHRDYWDPASEIYEGLPVIGGLMRWLARRFRASD